MLEFVRPNIPPVASTSATSAHETPRPNSTGHITKSQQGTSTKDRGLSFCNKNNCRYCKPLNKTGHVTSTTTGITHHTMVKLSSRSLNLIYAITCKRCGLQYVGQTLRRIRESTYEHFKDTEKCLQDKPVAQHFSQRSHDGENDITITVLEFIKKTPRSPEAITIRNRVERQWTHLLRTLAPQGLNQENPKEYHSHKKS